MRHLIDLYASQFPKDSVLTALVTLLLTAYLLSFALMYIIESSKAGARVSIWFCFIKTNRIIASKFKSKSVLLKIWKWINRVMASKRKG